MTMTVTLIMQDGQRDGGTMTKKAGGGWSWVRASGGLTLYSEEFTLHEIAHDIAKACETTFDRVLLRNVE